MKNWKIGSRMAGGFGAMICVAVALGLFAYSRVTVIDKSTVVLTADAMPGLHLIQQAQSVVHRSLALLLQHTLAPSRAEMIRVDGQIQDLRTSGANILNEYEKTITAEKDKELYEALKAARVTYWGTYDEILKLSNAEKHKEAIEVFNDRLKPLYLRYMETTD